MQHVPTTERRVARTTRAEWAQRLMVYGLGGCCVALLAGLVGLTVADIALRTLFNTPVQGRFELTELMLAALIFAALPMTTQAREHVEVDVLYDVSPGVTRRAMRALAALVSAAVLWVIAWRLAVEAGDLMHDGAVTNALAIPLAPIAWFGAAASGLSGFLALLELRRQPKVVVE